MWFVGSWRLIQGQGSWKFGFQIFKLAFFRFYVVVFYLVSLGFIVSGGVTFFVREVKGVFWSWVGCRLCGCVRQFCLQFFSRLEIGFFLVGDFDVWIYNFTFFVMDRSLEFIYVGLVIRLYVKVVFILVLFLVDIVC